MPAMKVWGSSRPPRAVLLACPTWWAASAGGAELLWSLEDARGLAANDAPKSGSRLDAEIAYGFPVLGGSAVAIPHAGWSQAEERGTLRLGQRLQLGPSEWRVEGEFADEARTLRAGYGYRLEQWLDLNVEASRREAANDDGADHEIMLRAGKRW